MLSSENKGPQDPSEEESQLLLERVADVRRGYIVAMNQSNA